MIALFQIFHFSMLSRRCCQEMFTSKNAIGSINVLQGMYMELVVVGSIFRISKRWG